MNGKTAQAPDVPDVYEEYQAWPPKVTEAVARYFHSALGENRRRCLILGCATGVNDALPLARLLTPGDRVVAGDIEPAFLERLRSRTVADGLANIDARRIDVTGDLASLGQFDLVSLLFVIHRLRDWEGVIDRLCSLLLPGGSFFISEFVGPEGIIYLSNENGGTGTDPVSRLIRRYFEFLPQRFTPPLKSTSIGPVLKRIEGFLRQSGRRDFTWSQQITSREMLRRIADRAYAPYFSIDPPADILSRLATELAGETDRAVTLEETIRIYRFERARP